VVCPNEVFPFLADGNIKEETGEDPECLYCTKMVPEDIDALKPLPGWVVPCLGSIPAYLALMSFKDHRVPLKIVTGSCDECENRHWLSSFRKAEADVKAVFESLKYSFEPFVIRIGTDQDRKEVRKRYLSHNKVLEERAGLSRRDFLLKFRNNLLSEEAVNKGKRQQDAASRGTQKKVPERLTAIIELFQKNHGIFSSGDKSFCFSEIEIDHSCTGCGACATLCPSGALSLKKTETRVNLCFTPSHCSRCDLCKEVCSNHSIKFIPGLDVQRILHETEAVIKSFHRHICPECHREHLSLESQTPCPYCRKQRVVMDDISRMIYEANDRSRLFGHE